MPTTTRPETTAPAMSPERMAAWFRLRGVQDGDLDLLMAEYAGKTEDEMDQVYDAMHGSMA